MELKKDIRKRVLAERNLISKKELEEKSHRIYHKVVTHPFFLDANEIYCYVDYKNEVETRAIIRQAWECGKKVAVPKVTEENMTFYYIDDFSQLETGYCGIMEPITKGTAHGSNVLIIMPGAAFDVNKNRIGYGKGFYDKYLELNQAVRTMALAFEFQMVDEIPAEPKDICPEVIITEDHIYV